MTQNVESTAVVAKQPLKGAAAAQAGYDYQLDVSILAALRLLLITKAASRLVLEPANEEDLEADLAPATPGRVQPSATLADTSWWSRSSCAGANRGLSRISGRS